MSCQPFTRPVLGEATDRCGGVHWWLALRRDQRSDVRVCAHPDLEHLGLVAAQRALGDGEVAGSPGHVPLPQVEPPQEGMDDESKAQPFKVIGVLMGCDGRLSEFPGIDKPSDTKQRVFRLARFRAAKDRKGEL